MKPLPPCIFPSVTEQDVVTVPGTEPCTAYRLRVEPGRGGYLRIEQMAYNEAMGWYTQKSFCLPGDVVHQLMPHLKQASALLPLPVRGSTHTHSHAMTSSLSLHAASSDNGVSNNVTNTAADTAPLRFPGPVAAPDDSTSGNTSKRKTS